MCGTTHKTVRRVIEAHRASSRGEPSTPRVERGRNYDSVAQLVAEKVNDTVGRISAKRLLPAARAAGYEGSDRNFRRLVADAKRQWRIDQARAGGRRPAIWTPGEVLAIDWGTEVVAGKRVHVFCAVLAWSRYRFVRFAADEQQATTLGLLAECFEELGGVPKAVLTDRMGCLKGNVVAGVVVPAPDYVSNPGLDTQQLEVEGARSLQAALPLGDHVGVDADPLTVVEPGQSFQVLCDVVLGEQPALSLIAQPGSAHGALVCHGVPPVPERLRP